MNKKLHISSLLIFVSLLLMLGGCSKGVTEYVNPFVGTGGHGHTTPAAIIPFGQIQVGPDTRLSGWDGCSGYHYSDDTVYGFSHTHLSGTGCEDLGDVMLMPVRLQGDESMNYAEKWYRSAFKHENEIAHPGYYSVKLDRDGTKVELTVNERCAYHKYTFKGEGERGFVLDLNHRDKLVAGEIEMGEMNGKEVITGYRTSKAWNPNQTTYFAIMCDIPFEMMTYSADSTAVWVSFGDKVKVVNVYVGISGVDVEGAKAHVDSYGGNEFEVTNSHANTLWEDALNKIEVAGGTEEQMKVFYTALYHCMTAPYVWSDEDGRYRGMDGNIHQAPENRKVYTVFSWWDTYRTLHPLLTMIDKKRTDDFIYTMLRQYEQGGELTMWELHSHETRCMIGYHSVPVILEALNGGCLDSWSDDETLALLDAMMATANKDMLGRPAYAQKGYLSSEDDNESVSKTLEYAYDDWCIAQYALQMKSQTKTAKTLKMDSIYREYMGRAQSWKSLMDEDGFMHARRNGGFLTPFDPTEVNNNFTEANSWQYSSYVPHDVSGWIDMLGGKAHAERFLDGLFEGSSDMSGREQADITGLIGQYAHGNEPSHHAAYLYAYLGKPEKTNALVNKILTELYTSKPDGLCGNEDCGQMSAWYVMSAMGLYPVCPGYGEMVTVSPLFDEVVVHVDGGEPLTINKSEWPVGKFWTKGAFKDEPRQFGNGSQLPIGVTPVPYFNDWRQSVSGEAKLTLKVRCNDAKIYYTLDGKTPDTNAMRYVDTIRVDNDKTIKAVAYSPQTGYSKVVEHVITMFKADRKLTFITKPADQYCEGGETTLIDRMEATNNYKIGGWQGWNTDMEVVIDMLRVRTIKGVKVGSLSDMRSWIFLPREVIVEVSKDGESYTPYGKLKNERLAVLDDENHTWVERFDVKGMASARYVKVKVINYGPLPSWHVSPGHQAWLFVDEVEVY